MRLQVILNILLLFVIFLYQLKGDFESIKWRNVVYIILYSNLISINYYMLKNTIIKIHRSVFISAIIYFGFSLITEIICFIYPKYDPVYVRYTHLLFTGTLLILILFIWLTFKSLIK